ncbi:MAG: class I tRNA ligase family protein [Enterocloster clostridioformis]
MTLFGKNFAIGILKWWKPRLYNERGMIQKAAAIWTLRHVLIQALKLLHPFMPFISRRNILQSSGGRGNHHGIPVAGLQGRLELCKGRAVHRDLSREAVRAIRGVRSSMNVPPSKKATVYVWYRRMKGCCGYSRAQQKLFCHPGLCGRV